MFVNVFKRLSNKITNHVVASKIRRLSKKETPAVKLIMTLLVRDEIDVVRKNIEFHLSHGVDFIVATDNGSVDGTLEVLKEYQLKGVLYLLEEPEYTHSQSRWVNRMGRLASDRFGADYVFHCDADEFWYSASGNLKNEMYVRGRLAVLNVPVVNVLLEDKGGGEAFPEDARYCVVSPYKTKNLEEDSKYVSIFLFRYPGSVFFRTKYGPFEVGEGNHRIVNAKKVKCADSVDIVIYHYPVRGKQQFRQKVINGGAALKSNPDLDSNVGWHWRRWYAAYQQGQLDAVYSGLVLNKTRAQQLIAEGMLVDRVPIAD